MSCLAAHAGVAVLAEGSARAAAGRGGGGARAGAAAGAEPNTAVNMVTWGSTVSIVVKHLGTRSSDNPGEGPFLLGRSPV